MQYFAYDFNHQWLYLVQVSKKFTRALTFNPNSFLKPCWSPPSLHLNKLQPKILLLCNRSTSTNQKLIYLYSIKPWSQVFSKDTAKTHFYYILWWKITLTF